MSQNRVGRHTVGMQIGGWASFAEVHLVVLPRDTAADQLAYNVTDLATDPRRPDWIAGVEFGVRYALEHLPASDRNVSIRVSRLHTNPVDSSTMAVAFATCFAIWDALGFISKRAPSFDKKSKAFVFPA